MPLDLAHGALSGAHRLEPTRAAAAFLAVALGLWRRATVIST
jgi:hypothetical protein